ncbi:MBL fold metallo-hydrolase [Corallococcus sp. CA053C]|uniref:ComEC/Rec2 family competence protein n=1 Tax=Corallococcus sp. CA053C TaxID=2316732 RepID=UPI000EA12446|nr:MBL fold metallo-hydrolase [Corallococcus sp. CA053C]RKH04921.1 MBL fold metallo-hydrolase [Corallococcus sp. CA053C]
MSPRIALGVGMLLAAVACQQQPASQQQPQSAAPEKSRYFGGAPDGKLHVYFFDVGGGEAALIVSPKGNTVLVDSGPASAQSHLVNRLPELLRRELDLVVLTHPDPKHHGALDAVLKRVGARRLMEPQLPDTSSAYDALLTAVGSRGVQVFSPAPSSTAPQEPVRLTLEEGVNLTVLWPRAPAEPLLTGAPDGAGANAANSIVLRLTYGDTSVLFAGAARAETESHLLALGRWVPGTLLKVASPGVEGANSQEFLEAVRPQAAVLSGDDSLGRDPKARSVLARLASVGASTFRTDVNGEVHAVSDGKKFELTPQRPSPGEPPATRYVFPGEDPRPPLVRTVKPPPPPAKTPPPETTSVARKEPVRALEAPRDTSARVSKVVEVDDLPTTRRSNRATSVESMSGGYVASRHKRIFHKPTCPSARRIHEENLLVFKTREEALRSDREPAGDCHP